MISNKILLSIAVSVGIAVFFTSPVRAKVLIDSGGAIILQSGIVLGDTSGSGGGDDGGEEDDSSGSGSSEDSDEEKQEEEQRDAVKQDAKDAREVAKQTAEEKREAAKQMAEVKREEIKQKLEAQKKVNKARFLMKQDGRKIRIDARDGQTRVRFERKIEDTAESEDDGLEDDDALENEIEDEREIEIEPGVGATNTKLRVLRSKAIVERLRARAITSSPLSVNPETNELSITTKRGDVKVVVLPDAAIQRLIENNIVDEIISEKNDAETETAISGDEEKDTVRLESEDESPVYKIAGIKRLKFLGLLPFESKVDATISAETGEVLERKQQFFQRMLSFFSTNAK